MTLEHGRLALALAASVGLHCAAGAWLAAPSEGAGPGGRGLLAVRFVHQSAAERSPRLSSSEPSARPVDSVGGASGADRADSADSANAPGARYFRSSEVDQRPSLVRDVDVPYPERDESRGYLVLRILINEAGGVDRVVPLVVDGGDDFQEASIAAFSGARFVPAQKNGVAVKSQIFVELKFEPEAAAQSVAANGQLLLNLPIRGEPRR
jgi:TonB-like protein